MCGFVGWLLPANTPRPDPAAWSECIRHRGPDQGGHAAEGPFGLGTRRLSILDLSAAGAQPMAGARYTLGFNGEIYNHLELRAELEAAGVSGWRSHSDTETVLRGVERWGLPETLARLNGMYALAVWDREREELSLARDPLGVKPLLYLPAAGGAYFASELRALLPFAPGRLSPEGLALYLLLGFAPAPYCLAEGVRKLRAGELLTFGPAGPRSATITPRAWARPAALAPRGEERRRQLREEVERAMRRQLLSDVPVGVFLSGGVDSTLIAGVAAAAGPSLASLSVRPDEAVADPGAARDAELAAALARRLGLAHHELLLRPADIVGGLDETLALMDEPVSELYFAAELLLSRRARAAGVPVVLTGHGGDEVFMGYPTYAAALKGDRYNQIPFFGPLARALAAAAQPAPNLRDNLRNAAELWRMPLPERYTFVSAVSFAAEQAAALSGLALSRVRELVAGVVADARAAAERLPGAGAPGAAELFARMDLLLKVPENYNMRLDRASMAASVEARVPLQDLDLVGFVMHLPQHELMAGGPKQMLKAAFADILPAAVAGRPKQTFQAPMRSWVGGALAPWVAARMAELPSEMRAAFPADSLAPGSTRQAYRLWGLALVEAWRRAAGLRY